MRTPATRRTTACAWTPRSCARRVVGEGGNLGLTQPGRIEYALAGGRIITDAIDNSGGVDCSDREVNIKILLDAVVDAGDMTVKQRNALLAEMTETVADLVLKDNYEQSETLTMAETPAPSMLDVHRRFIRALEHHAKLDRRLEALPDDEEMADRARERRGLPRPELAVLLAYSKVFLYAGPARLGRARGPLPVPRARALLPAAAPRALPPTRCEGTASTARSSRRRWSITCSTGPAPPFAFRLNEETGAPPSEIARAYAVAREVFEMRPQWQVIEALDNEVRADVQVAMLLEGRRLIERGSRWLLRNRRPPMDIASPSSATRPGGRSLRATVQAARSQTSSRSRAASTSSAAPACPTSSPRASPASRTCTPRSTWSRSPTTAGSTCRPWRRCTSGSAAGSAPLGARPDRGAAARGPLAGDGARRAARRPLRSIAS